MKASRSKDAELITSAVEGPGGGFVPDPSMAHDHALESAEVVRNAIANFPTSDAELGSNKDEAVQPFTDASTFLDVWTLEKNAAHRPVFLRAVATPDTLQKLLDYVTPEAPGQPRPSYLFTNSMGVLLRLFRDPVVAGTAARDTLGPVLQVSQTNAWAPRRFHS